MAQAQIHSVRNQRRNHASNADIPHSLHSTALLRFSPYPQQQTPSPTVELSTAFTHAVHGSSPAKPQKRLRTEASNHDQARALGFNQNQPRPLTEVLSDLEGFLQLQRELIMNAPLQPLFGTQWFEVHLCSKISELGRSTADKSAIGGIKNLNQLVRLHRELTGIGFRQMDAEFRMAISVQKAVVDSHGRANRVT